MKASFVVFATVATVLLVASAAFAEGRRFVLSYPPDVEERGSLGIESWVTGFSGQHDSTNTAWENRVGVEYSLSDRLSGTTYINFSQPGTAGSPARFEGPSLQLVYAFAEEGKTPIDPAALLEIRESGDELVLEPALLLQHEMGHWILGANVVGEFEYDHHAGSGSSNPHKAFYLTAGIARDVNENLSIALEGQYSNEVAASGPSPTAFFAGPTIDFHADKVGLTIGWHPQVSGTPASTGGRNLVDFANSQFRMILGVEL